MLKAKKVADTPELTKSDKLYLDLCLKTHNNINYDELFKRLSVELDKPEVIIRDYANKKDVKIIDQQLPPEPTPRVLHPAQEMVRNMITPNRLTESNKARHISVMSEAASDAVEKIPSSAIKGSTKMKDCVFRQ